MALGHSVLTAQRMGSQRANDAHHLLEATRMGRLLVTHNVKDFRLLHQAWILWQAAWSIAVPHASILILPHGRERDSAVRLDSIVGRLTGPNLGQAHRYRNGAWEQLA